MILIIRTFILYFLVMFSLRLMGKKQIGQMEPSELTVAIMISELATIPLSETGIPLLNGIVPVLILAAIEILVSIFVIKSLKFRKLVTGKPVIIVEKGILKEDVLRNTRFTTDDLLTEMRLKSISNITDIQYAILETGGQVSFILNKQNSPITFKDLNINIEDDFMPFPIISKGFLSKENLKIIDQDEIWLKKELKKKGYKNYSDILLLLANNKEIKFIQKKEPKK